MRSSLSFKRGTCHIMRTRNVCLPGFYTIIRVWLIITCGSFTIICGTHVIMRGWLIITCGSFIIIYGTHVIMHSTQIIQLRHKSICVVQLNMVQCMCILYGIFGFTFYLEKVTWRCCMVIWHMAQCIRCLAILSLLHGYFLAALLLSARREFFLTGFYFLFFLINHSAD